MKKWPKWLRRTILGVLCAAALAGAVVGVMAIVRSRSDAVNVYAVPNFTINYDTDMSETNGEIRTDKLQSVYVSPTQQVTEIYVSEGDTVKIGDPILAFDTTLTDLALERQRIAVEKAALDLDDARQQLAIINTYKVYKPSKDDPVEPEPLPEEKVPYLRAGEGTAEKPFVFLWDETCVFDTDFINKILTPLPEDFDPETGKLPVSFAIFEIRESNSLKGEILKNWMMSFNRTENGSFEFAMTAAPDEYEGSVPEEEDSPDKPVDNNVYYTYSEIAAMRADAEQKIVDLELAQKKAQLEYDTLEYELTNGMVYSKIDGVVKSVLDPEEAAMNNEPAVLISGGGGYFVQGYLSENELAAMRVGDTVKVMSWQSYEEVEATITEISEFPDTSGNGYHYNSSGSSSNESLYPFVAVMGEDAAVREGEWVQISYNPFGSSRPAGIFLENMFIRQEGGKSYVYVAGEDGRLVRREIKTGRLLWTSYTEVLSGLTVDDYMAFPYGRSLREGAKTQQSTPDVLYN